MWCHHSSVWLCNNNLYKDCNLRVFSKVTFLLLGSAQWPLLTKMGRIRRFAVQMTRRVNRGASQTGLSDLFLGALETRIKRGFPHFHSDDRGGLPGRDKDQSCQNRGPLTRNISHLHCSPSTSPGFGR